MSANDMTQSIREAAQALIDAIDAKLNDVIPYEQLADLRSALSAPQTTADERVAEHMRLVHSYIVSIISLACPDDERAAAHAAVEQSARALLSASQEDEEHAAMYRWIRHEFDTASGNRSDRLLGSLGITGCHDYNLDAAIRAAMNEAMTKTRSQNLHAAGFTRRPSAKSLPSDADEAPKMDKRLYTDCNTDEERAEFFASGRAYETGIVAGPIAMDIARAFYAQSLVGEITYPANMRKEEE